MVAGIGPCLEAFVGSSPRGDGHGAAGLPGLAVMPLAGLDQHGRPPLKKWKDLTAPAVGSWGRLPPSLAAGWTGAGYQPV
jgi:hypothetical protein